MITERYEEERGNYSEELLISKAKERRKYLAGDFH